jgi:hypothetical protein
LLSETVKLLIEYGGNPQLRDNNGRTALQQKIDDIEDYEFFSYYDNHVLEELILCNQNPDELLGMRCTTTVPITTRFLHKILKYKEIVEDMDRYKPGGDGALEAQKHFETAQKGK